MRRVKIIVVYTVHVEPYRLLDHSRQIAKYARILFTVCVWSRLIEVQISFFLVLRQFRT